MEIWRKVWREGFLPNISTAGLKAAIEGLMHDDQNLIQNATTSPPPLQCTMDWPTEAACLIAYCGWKGEGLETVSEVEEYFAKLCFACDHGLREPAAYLWFLNWFDEAPREEVRREMMKEIEFNLMEREKNGRSRSISHHVTSTNGTLCRNSRHLSTP